MEALVLQNLYKIYKEGDIETVALRGAELTVQPGEFVAITGRSGAGKSTLLSLIGGLAVPSAGHVIIDGTDIARLSEHERAAFRRDKIGLIYQADNLIPFLSALENVMLPMQLAGRPQAAARARDLLARVGLAERTGHRPGMLSGGERQRVAIAIALANEPQLLLADELTGELDSATADMVMDLLVEINLAGEHAGTQAGHGEHAGTPAGHGEHAGTPAGHGLTLVVVTHNRSVAARSKRQVNIDDGLLFESQAGHA